METKILSEHYDKPEYRTLEGYKRLGGGYEPLAKCLKMDRQQIINDVKTAGVRGRGGAGFPAGVKWGFLPDNGETRYLLCNADEGEPGTFKDKVILEQAPHQMIEGMIIAAFAINSPKSYVYIRGEYAKAQKIVKAAIDEAYAAGLLGENILGSGFTHHMDIYSGAGAYICGEETAMISSLEGKKGQPKLKPPFPAVAGYLGKPTIVNNVETFSAVQIIMRDGVEAYRKYGTEKSAGTKLFSISGDVMKPGVYEVPLGYPLKDLIEQECGGLRPGRKLKAVIPGGSSAPVLNAEESYKVTMDYEALAEMGSMLGSGAIIIMDDSRCMVDLLEVTLHFYHHESCGQCTPCREGTGWIHKMVKSIYDGTGRLQDIDLIDRVANQMRGRTICALADAASFPAISFVKKFRDEFEFYVREGRSKVTGVRVEGEAHA
ncbi:MAG: NADH-quinone oxidoreductase subunit NuoF [Bdellovibrionales bacterium]|nr:NADH-quinone oxidoreductase subunit NuoF [Bdellovibrionales bacterium]